MERMVEVKYVGQKHHQMESVEKEGNSQLVGFFLSLLLGLVTCQYYSISR